MAITCFCMAGLLLIAALAITIIRQSANEQPTVRQETAGYMTDRTEETEAAAWFREEPQTEEIKTGFQIIGADRYYYDSNGKPVTGFKVIDGDTYYFDSNGVMQTGYCWIQGEEYLFSNTGRAQTGWSTRNGEQYYYIDGKLARNTSIEEYNNIYYFGNNGQVTNICYRYVNSVWSDERFSFEGSGGSVNRVYYCILQEPIENCISLDFATEIGNVTNNISLDGTWVVCLRINGHWKQYRDTFTVENHRGSTTIVFDEPVTFDAFTTYRGNAARTSVSYNFAPSVTNVLVSCE